MAKSIVDGGDVAPMFWARRVTTGRPGSKAVLYTLATHANVGMLRAWLLLRNIAAESDMKPKSASDNIDRLARLGLIASIPLMRAADGQQTSSLYILNIDGWLDEAATVEDVFERCERRAKAIAGDTFEDVVPARFRVAPARDGLRLPMHQRPRLSPDPAPPTDTGGRLSSFPGVFAAQGGGCFLYPPGGLKVCPWGVRKICPRGVQKMCPRGVRKMTPHMKRPCEVPP